MIASGGAGRTSHVLEALDHGADAVALASILHYAPDAASAGSESVAAGVVEGNHRYLERAAPGFSKVQPVALSALKASIRAHGYPPGRVIGVSA